MNKKEIKVGIQDWAMRCKMIYKTFETIAEAKRYQKEHKELGYTTYLFD